jgi:adenine-specific DNA-methyltransferase
MRPASRPSRKSKLQRKIKELENERKKRCQELFEAQDAIDAQRDDLIEKVEARLTQSIETKKLFSIRWRIE